MHSDPYPDEPLPRRRFLLLGSAGILTIGLGALTESLIGKATEPLNESVERLLFQPHSLTPEFPRSAIEPEKLLINTFRFTPHLDPHTYRLQITGSVQKPLTLSLHDLHTLPYTSTTIRHVCVEGWAAIVQWGGIRLRDLLPLAQPHSQARYAYFYSADGYYESWDLDSALHPQTLLAYEKNYQPLPIANGAPLRLASPIKLGYKQSKWVTAIRLTPTLQSQRGTWEDLGYEWYAGL
ncbi:MAG: molybdopterin-dependent oxidoreductase [Oscillatoriales cyanobacterium SM2_2_1]|nr:molybdopterin-dependent oxidoreductase [Oscillatoriales cyanobacterium SM2_2_1]